MAALPDYLTKTQLPRLSDRATEGMGSSLPPHVSIQGNQFTLIDKSGEEHAVDTKHLDIIIIDLSDVLCKLYYGKKWAEDSKDPPLCWSSNGIAASREAIEPQNAEGGYQCNSCEWNKRGSAQGLKGVAIKACRDEKWLGVLIEGYGDMIFQFRVTPGSFTNWKAYAEKFAKQPFDIKDVVTRLQFVSNGVLTFHPVNYITAEQAALRNKLVTSKATDGIVGRLDQPIAGLAAVQNVTMIAATPGMPDSQPAPAKRGPKPKAKQETAPEAGNGPTTMAPFRPEAAPTFGVQDAPAPPAELANEIDTFFKS
jgi:hypothetical protein